MQSGSLNQKLKGLRSKATRRRAIALLSAVVMLITMNTLKLDADTLERIPTCGYAEEHVHDESCYIDGELSCGLEAHVHTDACFQERPVIAEPETEIYAEAEEEVVVSAEPVDSDAIETEAYMSGEEAQDDELLAIADAVVEPAFSLSGRDYITASEIAGALSLSPEALVGVSEVIPEGVDAEDYLPVLKIEQVGEDYIVIPARDFAECEIAIETDAELIAVKLTEGAALAAAEPEPQDDEAPERQEPDPDAPKADEAEEESVSEDETDSEEPISEDENDSEEPVSEDETDSEKPVSEGETDSEEPVSEGENDSEAPASEDETDSEEPISEDEDDSEEPASEEDDAEDDTDAPSDETEDDAQDDAQAPTGEPDVAPQAVARYTVVVDLAEVEAYPLYLNALLAMAAPTEEVAEAAPDSANAASDEAPAEGAPLHAEPADDAAPETVAALEDAAPDAGQAVEYDPALLSVVPVDGDYAVTPVSDFDEAVISTGETTVTLLNGRLEAAYPAQSFTASLPGITVTAAADAGALPMGTVMAVTEAGDAAASIAEAVEDAFVRVDRVHAVDITFTDALGAEVEPRVPVSVSLAVEKVEDDQSAVVVHLTDDGEAEVVPIPADEAASAGEADGAAPAQGPARVRAKAPVRAPAYTRVEFDADAFSVYAVVVTRRLETNFLDSAGDTYRITVEYAEGAHIPEGAALRVEEAEGEEYLAAAEAALEGGKRVAKGRFFDISILDTEGGKVQPDEPVQVSVTLLGDAGVSEPGAHVVDDGEPVAVAMHFDGETAVVETRAQDEAVVFEAEGFSVWGVVYTVDFYYGDYDEYHIAGGGATALSDLVEQLNIVEDGRAFAAEVADVWFSAPELVFAGRAEQACTVGQMVAERGLERAYSAELTAEELAEIDAAEIASGDWALISLQAFDTEERLTIAMNDGAVYVVRVKDAQIAARVLTADGETFIVTVTYGPEAGIPEGAALNAREITSEEEYNSLLDRAAEALDSRSSGAALADAEQGLSLTDEAPEQMRGITEARFFDISIVADGAPIEPAAAVQVSIAYAEAMAKTGDDIMTVVHFAEAGTEILAPETVEDEGGVSEVIFETESFSSFGVIQERMYEDISKGLIAYFPFDNNNTEDSLRGFDANGNVVARAERGTNENKIEAVGYSGSGLNLVVEQYYTLKKQNGDPLLKDNLSNGELTISYWANTNQPGHNWGAFVAPNANEQDNGTGRYLGIIHDTNTRVERNNGSAANFAQGPALKVGDHLWYHIVAVYGKDYTRLYIDGSLVQEVQNNVSLSDLLPNGGVFQIGKGNLNQNGGYFAGRFDELSVYNYALSEAEVRSLYTAYEPVTAVKMSVEDAVKQAQANPEAQIVVYSRVPVYDENGQKVDGKYQYYAITGDGSIRLVTDYGDTIGWRGGGPLEWNMTVHTEDGVTNGYFDFKNVQRGNYLAPQLEGRFSNAPIGLTMSGWNSEDYGSTIEGWDDGTMGWYGMKLNPSQDTFLRAIGDESAEFYFAVIDPVALHEDGSAKGMIAYFSFDGNSLVGVNEKGKEVAKANIISGSTAFIENGHNNAGINLTAGNVGYELRTSDDEPLLGSYTGKELTVSYWANIAETKNGQWGFFIYPQDYNGGNNTKQTYRQERYLGVVHNSGNTTMERYDTSQGYVRDTDTNPGAITGALLPVGENQWHQVTAVYGDGYMELYIDGKSQGRVDNPVDVSTLFESGSVFQIGKGNWENGEYFKGSLDELRIYNYALSGQEVEDIYNSDVNAAAIKLDTVKTVDNNLHGITIKMFDFPGGDTSNGDPAADRSKLLQDYLWSGYIVGGTEGGHIQRDLLQNKLVNGFPIVKAHETAGEKNLSDLFSSAYYYNKDTAGVANHLFIQSIYDETGYFEYDGGNNYAYLAPGATDFEVYRQTARPVGSTNNGHDSTMTSAHKGNFLPFDSLYEEGVSLKRNLETYDGNGQPLSETDPRYEADMYHIEYPNYFFGMTLEASFYQPKGGLVDGETAVFEFNGDDDMWVFVDDVLVLDIGGIHGPAGGTINFRTGEVVVKGVNGYTSTLAAMFKAAGVFPDGTAWTDATDSQAYKYFKLVTINGVTQYGPFVDYSAHQLKYFYLERGAGASNLRVRFNTPSLQPGAFVVEKEMPENVQYDYGDQKFAFVISVKGPWRETDKDDHYYYAPNKPVVYEGTNIQAETDTVQFGRSEYTVYYLRPGEALEFPVVDKTLEYDVWEIKLNTGEIKKVTINDSETGIVDIDGYSSRNDDGYAIAGYNTVKNRGRVVFNNVPEDNQVGNLRITKHSASPVIDENATFSFNLKLEDNKTGDMVPYFKGEYYIVKPVDGTDHYYKYENGRLVDNGEIPHPFIAGVSGSMSNIPVGYSVLIKNLLAGTDFYVEERFNDMEGYTHMSTEVESGTAGTSDKGALGTIVAGETTAVEANVNITNRPTGHIIAEKAWEDNGVIKDHGEEIMVALFLVEESGGEEKEESYTLVEGTLKPFYDSEKNKYWAEYFVPEGVLDDYVVREVKVTGSGADMKVVPVQDGEWITVSGETMKDGTSDVSNLYNASYMKGTETTYGYHVSLGDEEPETLREGRERTDTITNTLPKISAIKKDVDGQQSLNGAEFTLKRGSYSQEEWVDDPTFTAQEYTSGTVGEEDGVIFKDLYLSNGTYLLTETKAPDGYNLLPGEIQIVVGDNGILVTYGGSSYEHVDQTEQDDIVLTVLNTPGYELPSTGGPGTTAYTVSGLGLVLFALALLLRKRRI